ncbi:MAG: deoxyribonuclease IV [Bacillota bacterium]
MLIGAHISSAGSFPDAARRASDLRLDCVQHFTRNPRGGRQRDVGRREADRYASARAELGIDPVVMHIPYTVNLASKNRHTVEFGRRVVAEDLIRCELLGAAYLVLHPGSHGGAGEDRALNLIPEGLEESRDVARGAGGGKVTLLLEMMAGAGTEFGSTPEELASILEEIGWPEDVGICLDTCHSFARGYRLHEEAGLENYVREVDRILGLERVHVLHLNDSRMACGSRRDRHARLGRGEIGEEGLRRIINHPALRDLPMILEVPVDEETDYRDEADLARSWVE